MLNCTDPLGMDDGGSSEHLRFTTSLRGHLCPWQSVFPLCQTSLGVGDVSFSCISKNKTPTNGPLGRVGDGGFDYRTSFLVSSPSLRPSGPCGGRFLLMYQQNKPPRTALWAVWGMVDSIIAHLSLFLPPLYGPPGRVGDVSFSCISKTKPPRTALWAVWGMVDSICNYHFLSGNDNYRNRPVFALVEAICHRHIAFKRVRISPPPHKTKTPAVKAGVLFWWGMVDSNHRRHSQQIYSLSPLATREIPHIQLLFVGAGRRTRTPDLLITNQLLYQLSYTGGSNRTRLL